MTEYLISIQDYHILCSQYLNYVTMALSLQASLREIQVFTGGPKQVMLTTTTTDINGEFCVMLALGEYMVKVRSTTPAQSSIVRALRPESAPRYSLKAA